MSSVFIRVNHQYELVDGRSGIVKYIGEVDNYEGEWIGMQLDPGFEGKHDGKIDVFGKRYYKCHMRQGVFVRRKKFLRELPLKRMQPRHVDLSRPLEWTPAKYEEIDPKDHISSPEPITRVPRKTGPRDVNPPRNWSRAKYGLDSTDEDDNKSKKSPVLLRRKTGPRDETPVRNWSRPKYGLSKEEKEKNQDRSNPSTRETSAILSQASASASQINDINHRPTTTRSPLAMPANKTTPPPADVHENKRDGDNTKSEESKPDVDASSSIDEKLIDGTDLVMPDAGEDVDAEGGEDLETPPKQEEEPEVENRELNGVIANLRADADAQKAKTPEPTKPDPTAEANELVENEVPKEPVTREHPSQNEESSNIKNGVRNGADEENSDDPVASAEAAEEVEPVKLESSDVEGRVLNGAEEEKSNDPKVPELSADAAAEEANEELLKETVEYSASSQEEENEVLYDSEGLPYIPGEEGY